MCHNSSIGMFFLRRDRLIDGQRRSHLAAGPLGSRVRDTHMCIYIYIYIYTQINMLINIYIYIYREREREREMYVCIYIYIYMCILLKIVILIIMIIIMHGRLVSNIMIMASPPALNAKTPNNLKPWARKHQIVKDTRENTNAWQARGRDAEIRERQSQGRRQGAE